MFSVFVNTNHPDAPFSKQLENILPISLLLTLSQQMRRA